MTADIRTAAQREAERIWPINQNYTENQQKAMFSVREVDSYSANAFQRGAEWAAARVTPTREQIEDVLRKSGAWCGDCNFEMDHCSGCKHVREVYAESVLRLIQELAEGESDG